ncbi:EAL domain-containing protein [Clostridium formicaceticum]|nr:EAL domain-containing protein [Clostridium formicaceticum]
MTKKVFIYLFIGCILPTSLYGLLVYHKTNSMFKQEINKFTYDIMYNKEKNFELVMQNIESLIINLSGLDDIRNTLMNENNDNSYNRLAAQAKIGYLLSGYSNLKGLVSIDLFSMNGAHYHVGETLNYRNINRNLQQNLFEESMEMNSILMWHGIEDNIHFNSKHNKVVTASKVIKIVDTDTMKEKAIGFLMINYAIDAFTENIQNNTFEEALYMIVDNKNRIVHHPDKGMVGREINPSFVEKLSRDSGSFIHNIDGEETMVTYISSNKSGWRTITLIPLSTINRKTSVITNNLILLMIFYFLTLLLFVSLISKKYLFPIRKITELFKKLQEGNMETSSKLEIHANDEIGELVTGFNAFLNSVKDRMRMKQELLNRERLLKGITNATNELLKTTEYAFAFYKALEILGETTMADRVYIFRNHISEDTKELVTSQCYEWCREGVESQLDNPDLQNISYTETALTYWYDVLSSGESICGSAKDFLEAERAILRSKDILSILIIPIFIDHNFGGFMGFDVRLKERRWSKVEKDTLKIAAISIGGALRRIEAEQALQDILKDDLRKMVQNLQNLVFKLKKDVKGNIVFILFGGKLATKLGISTKDVYGKTLKEFSPKKLANYIEGYFIKAFNGEVENFDVKIKRSVFYVTLSPIIEGGVVKEVVGSAIDITQHRKAEEKIRHMAYYDTLTGLPNRIFFNERVAAAIKKADTNKRKIAILFLDLDQFKIINDTLGHATGDQLLREAAARLNKCISKDDIISRMGGDEFTVLLSNIEKHQDAVKVAERMLDILKQSFTINEYELFISASIGISLYPYHGDDIETLLKNADIAMYKAKDDGRNNLQLYTSTINSYAIERLNMENNLRKAIDQNEFFLHYQPKVDVETGKVVGCEALVRWQHPEMGLVSPNDFIPLAEETGLIISIGAWVLKSACLQNVMWHHVGYRDLSVSVNISAKQFQHQNIVEIVSKVLKETGLSPEHLELEITENCIMQNMERTIAIIQQLKDIGVKISIDDFGTGFSSMAYLREFEVDKLKIDKIFIDSINHSSRNAAIVASIINMAHSLDLKVIAEGVETEEQLSLLKTYKCNEIQGYLFSKPLSAEGFIEMITESKTSP